MPDEAVEVVGRRRARVKRHPLDLGDGLERLGHLFSDLARGRERGTFRHVQHDVEFVLIVEGEHLHGDELERHQSRRAREQGEGGGEIESADAPVLQQMPHRLAIDPVQRAFGAARDGLFGLPPIKDVREGPGRDDERDGDGEEHREGGADRDGPHVRAHQSSDESHRQYRRDHRPSRQERRITHLIHRIHGERPEGAAVRHRVMAVDVLDHDDGVVDEDADREDEGEERDAVEGVARELVDEQGEGKGHRHGDEDDEGLAQTEGEGDERGHREGGQHHMVEQLVGLVLGRRAVVARHGDARGGVQGVFAPLDPRKDLAGHGGGVGAAAF